MEIISYVGGGVAARTDRPQKSKNYPTLNLRKNTERRHERAFAVNALSASDSVLLESPVSVEKSAKRKKIRRERMSTRAFFFMTFMTLLVLSVAPYTVFKYRLYQDTHMGPLVLDSFFSDEVSILNSEMRKFAMDLSNAGISSLSHNVLDEEGNILSNADLGFSDVVTFKTYRVKDGETIGSIRRKFSLANDGTLINVNKIENVRNLMAGQKLKIPSQDGILHKVGNGENLTSIATKYNVPIEEILDVNDLETDILAPGKELFIPGAMMDETEYRKSLGELFACPLSGKWYLSSPFGKRINPITGVAGSNHNGIDMAISAGTKIKSTMSGDVAYVGYSNVYGNYVIINHLNGYQSLYAHMSKTLARQGQKVGQGTVIGLVGSTGMSTGPHLHFTIYKNGKAVDPQKILNLKKR
ncbi:peptidoglycan DD-metalloendopeptidase family protein [Treponema zioleckii]|uniref:peptidoglycan DD-metalloendopeptidase family protein n=1 Tax=Treponema zioleckii TaxID=331680 RepID=UPI00168AFD6C|nr:M23 family metallopeptidase [Treponema zioleckii]